MGVKFVSMGVPVAEQGQGKRPVDELIDKALLAEADILVELGRPGVERDSVPERWLDLFDSLHVESETQNPTTVYSTMTQIERSRFELPEGDRFGELGEFLAGEIKALDVSLGRISQSRMSRPLPRLASRDRLIQGLAVAQSERLRFDAGDVWAPGSRPNYSSHINGEITAFEWVLGRRPAVYDIRPFPIQTPARDS